MEEEMGWRKGGRSDEVEERREETKELVYNAEPHRRKAARCLLERYRQVDGARKRRKKTHCIVVLLL